MKRQSRLFNILICIISINFVPSLNAMAMVSHFSKHHCNSLAPTLEKVLPAVVSIYIEGREIPIKTPNLMLDPFKKKNNLLIEKRYITNQVQPPFTGLGSGVIIDAHKGYILTNNHVINGANKINVRLNDNSEHIAQLIGFDEQTDIALIKINTTKQLTQMNVANSDKLKIGDFAVAIGNPFGLGETATSGIISALGRSGLHIEGLENFIQTDAAINKGNSGGALVNLHGELIGINTAILASSGGNIGIGFAIPSNMAIGVANQLIKYGEIKRTKLGIKSIEMNNLMSQTFNTHIKHGAFIIEVMPNSPAYKAGIKAGDIITAINDKLIWNFDQLRITTEMALPGQNLKISLLRGTKKLVINLVFPKANEHNLNGKYIFHSLTGAVICDITSISGSNGIKVKTVEHKSPAELIGLKKGDIIIGLNTTRINTIQELRKIFENKPLILALNIMRGTDRLFILL
ncbi:MAG: Do family serine endopeptidase [Pantoea sp. Brub]|nr:Do family serine endopeptidase [Pantoea sp. Brub]